MNEILALLLRVITNKVRKVSSLLSDPLGIWVIGAICDMQSPGTKVNKKEHITGHRASNGNDCFGEIIASPRYIHV